MLQQHHMQHRRNIKVNRAFKETLFQDLHDKHSDKKVTFEKRRKNFMTLENNFDANLMQLHSLQ